MESEVAWEPRTFPTLAHPPLDTISHVCRATHTTHLLPRSYHPRFSPTRTSSTIFESVTLIGTRPPSRPMVYRSRGETILPPSLSHFVQRQRIFRLSKREDNGGRLITPFISPTIATVLSDVKLGNWDRAAGFRKGKRV